MKDLIKDIEAELKAARNRSSTNNSYDYPYANGIEYALNKVKLFTTPDVRSSLPCLNECLDKMDSIGDEFCRWKDDEDGYPTNEMEWDGYVISKDGVEKFIKFCQGNDGNFNP